jgi:hypothetical protein
MNKHGAKLYALSSALEMHGDPVFISFYGSGKASLSLQNLYARIASHKLFCIDLCSSGNNNFQPHSCQWSMPLDARPLWWMLVPMWAAFQLYIAALGCHVASFELNRNPRCYLETSAGSPRPASPQMDNLFCGNIRLEGSR